MKTAFFGIIMAIMLFLTTMPAIAKSDVPVDLSTETITLNLKGGAAQNAAKIQAALDKFLASCAEMKIYAYEVKIHNGNVKAIVVKYT